MDPRTSNPQQRKTNHSPLMQRLVGKQLGEVVNACPYGCRDEELDEQGYCGHLIGFYNGGQTFEPRVLRKIDNRIITSGANRQPMKRGYKMVKITSTARVYSPEKNPDLTPKIGGIKAVNDMLEQEKQLAEFAERVRNPILEGEWDGSAYEPTGVLAAAANGGRDPTKDKAGKPA